jgi:hypothetical protein
VDFITQLMQSLKPPGLLILVRNLELFWHVLYNLNYFFPLYSQWFILNQFIEKKSHVAYSVSLKLPDPIDLLFHLLIFVHSNSKPKNARAKRFLKNREAKVHENPKNTLVVRGSSTSQIVNDALKDLVSFFLSLSLSPFKNK